MAVFLVFACLLIGGLVAAPTVFLRKCQPTTRWDYLYPFMGIIGWFVLSMLPLGSTASLTNFVVEIFWISLTSAGVPWLRWILVRYGGRSLRAWSVALTVVPILVAVGLRLTMPTLPE